MTLVVANWKMHGSQQKVIELINGVASGVAALQTDVVICPPVVFLNQAAQLIKGTRLSLGAQTVNAHSEGAYTGEVSPSMLSEAGCQYVIVGHSERRTLYKETDADVVAKCLAVITAKMIPIVCVGETLNEREAGTTEDVIRRQVMAVLNAITKDALEKIVIAYEPVWAIGTGKTATSAQAQEVHALIRELLRSVDSSAASKVHILYGGSVKAANAKELFTMPDIDGGLVGGASLVVDEFVAICRAAI